MNDCRRVAGFDPRSNKLPLNRWIVGATARAVASVTRGIEEYRFNEAANGAYDFVWGTFCDWFVELAKPVLSGEDEAAKAETRATAAFALDQILKLLHPFMPYVTEELWAETGKFGPSRDSMLVLARWPELAGLEDPEADAEINWLVALISGIRSVRTEMNVPVSAKLPLLVSGEDTQTRRRLEQAEALIARLARVESIASVGAIPRGSAQLILGEATFALPLGEVIDIEAEKSRLGKEAGKLDGEIADIDKKLNNAQFVAKAPGEVIEEQRSRRQDALERRAKIEAALARLS
jgi:valyl-tRNA synthetase